MTAKPNKTPRTTAPVSPCGSPTAAQPVLLVDLAAIVLRRQGNHVEVSLPGGEVLASIVAQPGESVRAVAGRAFDRALGVRVPRAHDGALVAAEVLLVNPVTALVARRRGTDVIVLGDRMPVELADDGTLAEADGCGLHLARGRVLPELALAARSVTGEVMQHAHA